MILYDDPDILVVNKPSGLLVVPDGYDHHLPTLATLLEPQWGRLWIVHRLDKETSGAIILARNPAAHRQLSIQFAQHSVRKTYHALCAGAPEWQSFSIQYPLRVNGDRRHRTVWDAQRGKAAQTLTQVVRRLEHACLVSASPFTGYTHQIRAHLALVGLPLLGDPLYSYPPSWDGPRLPLETIPPFPRTALHAFHLTVIHPGTSETIHFTAPYPSDFSTFLTL